MDILSVDNLHVYNERNEKILDNINFSLKKGQTLAIIGTNNSGKTSLSKALRGFIPRLEKGRVLGDIELDGKNLREWKFGDLANFMGIVLENSYNQNRSIMTTVYDEVSFGLENIGESRNNIIKKTDEILENFGIYSKRYEDPNKLSAGERQILSLISSLVMNQKVYILDEAFSELDYGMRARFYGKIEKMKNQGKSFLILESDIRDMGELADFIGVLYKGRLVMLGRAEDVLCNKLIEHYGLVIPDNIMLFQRLKKEGYPIDEIPIAYEDQLRLLRELLEGDE